MSTFTEAHDDWLTVAGLAAYAPELNPVAVITKNRLKRTQYRPGLIDGFLAQTGLSIESGPP